MAGFSAITERILPTGCLPIRLLFIVDYNNWSELGTISITSLFNSKVLSKDGRNFYPVNPEQGSVTISDTATNKEIGNIKGIGKTLSLIILSP